MKVFLIFCFFFLSIGYANDEYELKNYNDKVFKKDHLHIVTFNMLHGFSGKVNENTIDDRLQILAQNIVKKTPDVILLQEASVMPEVYGHVIRKLSHLVNSQLPSGQEYNYIYARANGSAPYIGFEEGSAIFSRFRIEHFQIHTYEKNSPSLPETRIALRVSLASAHRPIHFISTHLTNRDDIIEGKEVVTWQAKELAQKIIPPLLVNKGLVIAGGDFNTLPKSPAITEIIKGQGIDLFAISHPENRGCTSFGDHFDLYNPHEKAETRIDYLFLFGSQAKNINDSSLFLNQAQAMKKGHGKFWLWASDHIGVEATISTE